MKLRNKNTGEIGELSKSLVENRLFVATGNDYLYYDSLTELCEEWEDQTGNAMFYVNECGVVCKTTTENDEFINWKIGLGNLFKTEAEAGLAAQKLCAWKRIKDAGLLNSNWHYTGAKLVVEMEFAFDVPILDGDLDMVFKK